MAKALDVLNELVFSLDRENGDRWPTGSRLSTSISSTSSTRADRDRDGARLDRVIQLAASLQEAWIGAAGSVE